MNVPVLVTGPVAEPVSVADMLVQLGMTPIVGDDSSGNLLAARLEGAILAARVGVENYLSRALLTQTWLLAMDGFPPVPMRYSHQDRPHDFVLSRPPFQSVVSFTYVDTTGTQQTLTQDTSNGSNFAPPYGYQLPPVGADQSARLFPVWARPWPPTRWMPGSVQVTYKCGYGGPVSASMDEGSRVLTGPKFVPGDAGQAVSVPAAGAGGGALVTSILSVDDSGNATLAANAVAAVALGTNNVWVGRQVPATILHAIKLYAEFLFAQGGETDQAIPRVVTNLLDYDRNLVS